MYIISVLTTDNKIIDIMTDDKMVVDLCEVLEYSKVVINFKISNSCSTGINQKLFGCGGFEKWKDANFNNGE